MIQALGVAIVGLGLIAYSQKNAIADEVTVTVENDAFTRWDPLFRKYSGMYDCPWRWLKAICWIESDLGRDPSVVRGMEAPADADGSKSSDGLSWGLMQLTIDTANRRRVRPGTTVADLNNPEISVECAAKYLHELGTYYFAWDREGCVRAYNGGIGWREGSERSLSMTADYYAKFQDKLSKILGAQPGDEMERGT